MKDFWRNIDGIKQLMFVGLLFIIVVYACYWGKFDFLTGISTGIFAALGITKGGNRETDNRPPTKENDNGKV